MPEFFTVDRMGKLLAGQILTLKRHKDVQPTHLQLHVDRLFPKGVSSHGEAYFLRGSSFGNMASPYIELGVEYVRRANYSKRVSRFQSFFGAESLDLAKYFRQLHGKPNDPIWKVKSKKFFKGDMAWFSLDGASILYHSSAFHNYWKGNPCPNPFWEILMVPPVTVIAQVA